MHLETHFPSVFCYIILIYGNSEPSWLYNVVDGRCFHNSSYIWCHKWSFNGIPGGQYTLTFWQIQTMDSNMRLFQRYFHSTALYGFRDYRHGVCGCFCYHLFIMGLCIRYQRHCILVHVAFTDNRSEGAWKDRYLRTDLRQFGNVLCGCRHISITNALGGDKKAWFIFFVSPMNMLFIGTAGVLISTYTQRCDGWRACHNENCNAHTAPNFIAAGCVIYLAKFKIDKEIFDRIVSDLTGRGDFNGVEI